MRTIFRARRTAAVLTACLLTLITATSARAQDAEAFKAELNICADLPRRTINRNIYGQFVEHLGRGIYDGLWVGEASRIPNTRGIRNDVLEALRRLSVPVIRWPGGCFADQYHWRDGIGPRERRPRRLNTSWGGVIETNAFGTHEFLDLCELLKAEPYIAVNVGSGSPQELMEWVEYMTSDSDSELANLRRRNGGAARGWKVTQLAIGNEPWGCGGNMRAEFYSDLFRRYATFVKDSRDLHIDKVASGGVDSDFAWTETLMSRAGKQMDGYSLHFYTLPTGDWAHKGSATEFGEEEWHKTLMQTLRMDDVISDHSSLLNRYDPDGRIGMIIDEWGTWYDPVPGVDMGALYQQNTLRDAVVAAVNLNIFNQHSDRVRMANIAQMVNVLQAMILTDRERMLLTPTYHVFEMYKVHQGATMIPVEINAPDYIFGMRAVPSLHASASRDKSGALHLSIVNLNPNRPAQVLLNVSGATPRGINGRVLTAGAMNSTNTFERPDVVRPAPFTGVSVAGGVTTLNLPAKSVVVLELR